MESLTNLQFAGAEIAAITANTGHIIWDRIYDQFPLPVISIVEAAVNAIEVQGFQRILVFGTSITLKSGLYENTLIQKGLIPIIPLEQDIEIIGKLIYPNLENGIVIPADKEGSVAGIGRKVYRRRECRCVIVSLYGAVTCNGAGGY